MPGSGTWHVATSEVVGCDAVVDTLFCVSQRRVSSTCSEHLAHLTYNMQAMLTRSQQHLSSEYCAIHKAQGQVMLIHASLKKVSYV